MFKSVSVNFIESDLWEFNVDGIVFKTIDDPSPDENKTWSAPIQFDDGTIGKIFWNETKEYSKGLERKFPYAPDPCNAFVWDKPIRIDGIIL